MKKISNVCYFNIKKKILIVIINLIVLILMLHVSFSDLFNVLVISIIIKFPKLVKNLIFLSFQMNFLNY
jgi:hypothetical protein